MNTNSTNQQKEHYNNACANAQTSNRIAATINAARDILHKWAVTITRMDEAVHPIVAFFAVLILGCAIWGEYVFSKDLYKDIMPEYPYVPVAVLVFFGLIISEQLKYAISTLNELEAELYKVRNPNMVSAELKSKSEKQSRNHRLIGYLLLIGFSVLIVAISHERVIALIGAKERIDNFGIFDLLPLLCFWLEIIAGTFALHAIRRFLLAIRTYFLQRKIKSMIKSCSYHTDLAVEYWEQCEDVHKPNDELLIAIHRKEHKCAGQPDYTDLNLNHVEIQVTDAQNQPIKGATVSATTADNDTVNSMPIHQNNAVILNWNGTASTLSSLIVNGQIIQGQFVKGGVYKVQFGKYDTPPRNPIGFNQ
jgi:hypothetical protein